MTTDTTRPRRPAISRERIVDAAIGVIDEQGIEGLTMRRLGAALSADPMAAYLHFQNKAELLDAVVEHQAAKLFEVPPLDGTDVIELMVGLARHYRSMLLEHPNLAPLVTSRPLPQARAVASMAESVGVIQAAGFADDAIPVVFDALVAFSFGYVLHEAERARGRELLGVPFLEQQQDLLDQLVESPGDTSVAEAVIARRLSPDANEEAFTVGLRAMLLGLRAGLGTPPSAPST